jgi:dethiobiotin synthetase
MSLQPIEGLLVAGTHPKCGKTVFTAGFCAALTQAGMKVQPMKPLTFQQEVALFPKSDQAFFDVACKTLQSIDPLMADSPYDLPTMAWHRVIEMCRKSVLPAIIESPGAVSTPLRYDGTSYLMAADWAKVLGIPMVIVTEKHPNLLTQALPIFSLLQTQSAPILGWVAVETTPIPTPHWAQEELYLSHTYRWPCLGTIPYNNAVSVENLQPGPLVHLIDTAIDLLPLQQVLKLCL